MSIDQNLLMAYVDGELPPAEAARVNAAIAADPALADAVARQRALRRLLQDAHAPLLEEPVPEALTRLLRGDGSATDKVVALKPRPPQRWALPQWAAMAASLLLGVAVTYWALQQDAARLQDGAGGSLIAGADLARGLERQLAGAPDVSEPVAVGLTFRDNAGHYCRSFAIDGSHLLAGLACRQEDGDWTVPVVMEAPHASGAELRQAATALPPAVLAEVEARMGGEPLDAAQERQARDSGWR
ncbi:MAG: zf-HC2 domain-containing protein [Lysobacter sp.]|nr:zf-HC2 domain-containing protein [Lysobacter sp.]